MRRKEKEITDRNEIESIIAETEICYLAMSTNDSPYVIPLNFGYEDNCLYFHCARNGKKLDMIRQNNRVSFSMSTDVAMSGFENIPCNQTTKYRSVIGFGTAEIIEDTDEKIKGLDILMRHYSSQESFTYSDKSLNNTAVVKITITELSGKKSS